jgi:glycosyltransferase involved in cell wall biosynthesis
MLSEITLEKLCAGDNSLVSVIIPTYKDSDYLSGAVESVVDQSYRPIEIIIIDSSGVASIEEFATKHTGIKYRYQEPSGLSAARNAGIEEATGDVIAFLDADDRWQSEKLNRQMAAINNGAEFVYSDAYIQSSNQKRYISALSVEEESMHHIDFFRYGGIPCASVVVTRTCLDEKRFDETLTAAEDRHMWIRLLACERCDPERIAEPLAIYSQRDNSVSSDINNMYHNEKQVITDVTETFDELSEYRSEAFARADYKLGKRHLKANQATKARQALKKSIHAGAEDNRVYLLLILAYLPLPPGRSLAILERIQARIRRLSIS